MNLPHSPFFQTTSSEAAGLRAVVRALNEIDRQLGKAKVGVLLENTAGQGSCLGWRFEHLGKIIDGVKRPERLSHVMRRESGDHASEPSLPTSRATRRGVHPARSSHGVVGRTKTSWSFLSDVKRFSS